MAHATYVQTFQHLTYVSLIIKEYQVAFKKSTRRNGLVKMSFHVFLLGFDYHHSNAMSLIKPLKVE